MQWVTVVRGCVLLTTVTGSGEGARLELTQGNNIVKVKVITNLRQSGD